MTKGIRLLSFLRPRPAARAEREVLFDRAAEILGRDIRGEVPTTTLSGLLDTILDQRAELVRRRAEVARLDEALEFYADPSGWNQPPVKTHAGLLGIEYENQASKIQTDRGRRARAARMPAEGRAAIEQEGG